jgi:hypothetical protein
LEVSTANALFAVDLLGAEQVLLVSDWQIMPIASRHYVDEVLARQDLTEQQTAAILGGNTARLLANPFTST